jgi:hypothetical protein
VDATPAAPGGVGGRCSGSHREGGAIPNALHVGRQRSR